VDWFSKNILPTQPFKLFMKKVCPNITSANLAAMPFDFLRQFESGDRYAINCLPTNHIEAQTLYSFVNQYRKMAPDGKFEPSYRKVEEKKPEKVMLKSTHELAVKASDVTIPVLISGAPESKQKSLKQDDQKPIESISKQKKVPVEHVVGTYNNTSAQARQTTDTRKIISQIPKTDVQTPPSQQLFTPVGTVATFTTNRQSRVANLPLASERVNPRWNAEVQQFIGRTKSANSRPIYLEYLESKGVTAGNNEANENASVPVNVCLNLFSLNLSNTDNKCYEFLVNSEIVCYAFGLL